MLSLAYVASDEVRLDDAVFDEVAHSLSRLELDSSPALLRSVLASDAILVRLSGVGHLSARSSDLTSVRDDLSQFLPASVVRLSSARWHCDRRLVWLRDWLRGEAGRPATDADVSDMAKENRSISRPSSCILSLLPPQRDSTITSWIKICSYISSASYTRTKRFTS